MTQNTWPMLNSMRVEKGKYRYIFLISSFKDCGATNTHALVSVSIGSGTR